MLASDFAIKNARLHYTVWQLLSQLRLVVCMCSESQITCVIVNVVYFTWIWWTNVNLLVFTCPRG